MKRYLGFILRVLTLVTLVAVGFNSCKEDKNEGNKSSFGPVDLDPNRPQLGAITKPYVATVDAFYNGLTNEANAGKMIIIDIRSAADYAKSHIKGAVNVDCAKNDDAYWYDDADIYKYVDEADPTHSKQILVYDAEGASQFTTRVVSRIAGKGWGEKNTFMLTGKYSEFASKYSDMIE